MVEQEPSVTSDNSVTSVAGDGLPSIASNSVRSNDHRRLHNHVKRNELTTSSSRFRGVSSQNNGHWGAQIYVNQQRIWLGTFKSEEEAAMAYDSAAIKLRNGDSQRNFPWTSDTVLEPDFQSQFNVEEVLVMIKDGTYSNKFSEYLKASLQDGQAFPGFDNPGIGSSGQELFQKELTPSDVGKLNRLVIPKKFAVKYFPSIVLNQEQIGEVISGVQDTDLYFHDKSRRSWKFRYCYWKSSQSFVFTRGWNRFVKEKGLKAGDVIVFSMLENNLMIDILYRDATRNNVGFEDASELGNETTNVKNNSCSNGAVGSFTEHDIQMGEVEEENAFQTIDYFAKETMINKQKGLRLFGVQIV
ncbi:hypothetical protein Leryth_018570 [Lithospermum erythrorhizon]|nr:hypothetical protein Leryth_018570 [Lithospermum erythrorhizon]